MPGTIRRPIKRLGDAVLAAVLLAGLAVAALGILWSLRAKVEVSQPSKYEHSIIEEERVRRSRPAAE